MYNNPYINQYSQQANLERINAQINELENMKKQMQQPVQQPTINQNFQLAPNNNTMKFVNTIDDVSKEIVYSDTPFFSKDMSVMWVKNAKGDIKSFELNEIVPLDEKDIQIKYLQEQINEMKKEMKKNDADSTNVITKQNATNTTEYDETDGTTIESKESDGIQKIRRSKKEQ